MLVLEDNLLISFHREFSLGSIVSAPQAPLFGGEDGLFHSLLFQKFGSLSPTHITLHLHHLCH